MMLEEMLLNICENGVPNLNVEDNIITQNIFNCQFSTYSLIHICITYRDAVIGSSVMRYLQISVFHLLKMRCI